MDLDDKVVHYLLWFGGMFLAEVMHRAADAIGWDTVQSVKKLLKRRKA